MNIDKLKEANEKLKKFYYDDSKVVIVDFIEAYIKAMESGLPERRNGNGNHGEEQWKTCVCEACFDARTFNECYDLILPHLVANQVVIKKLEDDLVAGDEKIRELEKWHEDITTTKNNFHVCNGKIKPYTELICSACKDGKDFNPIEKIEQLEAKVKQLKDELESCKSLMTDGEKTWWGKIKDLEADVKRLKGEK